MRREHALNPYWNAILLGAVTSLDADVVTLDATTLIVPLGQCHVRQRALQLSAYALRPKPISAYVSVASIVYPAIVPGIKTLHKI